MKKKILLAVILVATGFTAFSFYADAYDPVKEKGMQTIERKAETAAVEIKENRETKAINELEVWEKMSRADKLKKVELEHSVKVKKSAEKWAKKSADKKIAEYEKRLKKKALPKAEKDKIAKAKLAEKCKGVDEE